MNVLDSPTLKALNTKTRQEIIKLLSKRPYTASELSKLLGKHVTTVSEHLNVLEKSSLVQKKTGNKWIYYNLTTKAQSLSKPQYSWSILFSSIISLIAGGYLYTISQPQYAAQSLKTAETTTAADAPAITAAAENIMSIDLIFGIALIIIALLGFAFFTIKYLRARTLTKRSLYIE